ncbi:MAG TPA: hypothetical protein VMT20_13185 [Terriglobia bacterium]|nr:hypothetical protein [Terriglobia bacterium]
MIADTAHFGFAIGAGRLVFRLLAVSFCLAWVRFVWVPFFPLLKATLILKGLLDGLHAKLGFVLGSFRFVSGSFFRAFVDSK